MDDEASDSASANDNANADSSRVPSMGVFGMIPNEIIEVMFTFLSLVEIEKSVRRVCKVFYQITDPKQEESRTMLFWKNIVVRDVRELMKIGLIEDVEWSIQQRGYYRVGKTLWLESQNKLDEDWIIHVKLSMTGKLISYEGQRQKGQRTGRARIRYVDGTVYEGQVQNDDREGKGIMKYADGSNYEGEWKANLREGKGTMKYADGSSYEGGWSESFYYGEGIERDAQGREYSGQWMYGSLNHGERLKRTTIMDPYNSI